MGQSLGRPVYVMENGIREWRGDDCGGQNPPNGCNVPYGSEIDIQRRMKEKAITIKVDVTATFDIRCRFDRNKETKIFCKKNS